jgi:hypothetical protein
MAKPTPRQLRGLNELVADAVDAGVLRIEQFHRAVARYPYAALERITLIAAPVRTVQWVETAISGSVYWTIRLAATVSGRMVAQVLERLDERRR